MSKDGMDFVSLYGALFKGEPIPKEGKMTPPDLPGWGVELDHALVKATRIGLSESSL
jgi:L-alanine-DL-glutamate epimerase-like enolase superfamily enzyme